LNLISAIGISYIPWKAAVRQLSSRLHVREAQYNYDNKPC